MFSFLCPVGQSLRKRITISEPGGLTGGRPDCTLLKPIPSSQFGSMQIKIVKMVALRQVQRFRRCEEQTCICMCVRMFLTVLITSSDQRELAKETINHCISATSATGLIVPYESHDKWFQKGFWYHTSQHKSAEAFLFFMRKSHLKKNG